MLELNLFSGAGGGLLATQHLLGWTTVGYVENEAYCQGILARRMDEGFLCRAPIFGDIRRFIGDGYAKAYQGVVDVITAGFPCQPFSVAGKREGEKDERNMWPETIECIRLVRPRWALLENVPGLIACGYLGTILGDLAEAGFDARWAVIGADDVGAPHRRKRLWIVADSKCAWELQQERRKSDERRWASDAGLAKPDAERRGRGTNDEGQEPSERDGAEAAGAWWEIDPADLPITEHNGCGGLLREARSRSDKLEERPDSDGEGAGSRGARPPREEANLPDAEGRGCGVLRGAPGETGQSARASEAVGDATSARCTQGGSEESRARRRKGRLPESERRNSIGQGPTESRVGRVAHGVAHRVDRLKALGNGQVSEVAAVAWEMLS